jgi:putative phage-type endonuclease
MKTYNFEQRSLEWYAARAGVITASEIDSLVSPLWKIRESKGVESYMMRKIAERWMGGSPPTFQSDAMEFGIQMEQRAFDFYRLHYSPDLKQVGFITDDSGKIGCSPDGMIGDNAGLEIKCPNAETHVGYLLSDNVPPIYSAQIQFSLYVTGRAEWNFMSYRPGFPVFIKNVKPSETAFAAFDKLLPSFLIHMDEQFDRLAKLNGGLPDRNIFREEIMRNDDKFELDETEIENDNHDLIP